MSKKTLDPLNIPPHSTKYSTATCRKKKQRGKANGTESYHGYKQLSWCLLNPIDAKPCEAIQEHPSRTAVSWSNIVILHNFAMFENVKWLWVYVSWYSWFLLFHEFLSRVTVTGCRWLQQYRCAASPVPLHWQETGKFARSGKTSHIIFKICGAARLGLK